MADEHLKASLKNKGDDGAEKAAPKTVDEQVEAAANDTTERVAIRMLRGTYIGLGCPDPQNRLRSTGDGDAQDDTGYSYTHEHPARAVWKEETVRDASGNDINRERYVTGEIVVLYPLQRHELDTAKHICASEKRFTFSLKEALKRKAQMIAKGTACDEHDKPTHIVYPVPQHGQP
jgi:hypothetical protein